MSAGEQLYVTPQVAALFAALPGAALHNHYGPTETHAATWLPLDRRRPRSWPERPTIGRPLDHAARLPARRRPAAGAGRASRASCTWAAPAWRAATSAGRS